MKLTKIILEAVFVFASIIAVISMLYSKKSNYKENLKREKERCNNNFLASFKAFVSTYKLFLIVILISALAVISIDLFAIIDGPPPVPTAIEEKAQPTLTPIPVFGEDDVWLDEIDPILPNTEAVITNEWDPLTKISVKGVSFEHGIGFFIPKEKQDAYLHDHNGEQITHSESIEYSLANKYQTLYFDYGIDDSSFTSDATSAPACEFKIVVQACNSSENLKQDVDILFGTAWMNYRTVLHNSGEIDVSEAEAIRITVYWKFSVSQTKPFALNIALVNPILYAVKD